MNEWLAFLLPPATAFVGARLNALVFGKEFEARFGAGLKFTLGLAVGMLVFSQAALFCALAGISAFRFLAWLALLGGAAELAFQFPKWFAGIKHFNWRPSHGWLLLLIPVIWWWWVFGRLSPLEGTLEFDANQFWVFKAKIIYLKHGSELVSWFRNLELTYMHWDYPLLVPCLYTLDYGIAGSVNEFLNKVWPFWMIAALCIAVLSLSDVWKNPRPLPIFAVIILCFLPATLRFARQEGGTVPMVFYTSVAVLMLMQALANADKVALIGAIPVLAGCAATKFEGVIFDLFWIPPVLWLCWKHKWLKTSTIWKAVALGVICLLPYAWFRALKPTHHPESEWLQTGLASPHTVAHRLIQVLFLNVTCRFFQKDFYHWSAGADGGLHWDGHWAGLHSLVNDELSMLPWLLVLLGIFSMIWRPRHRLPVCVLAGVVFLAFAFLSFVISCLSYVQADVTKGIGFASDVGGRYCYPYLMAAFVGIVSLWNPTSARAASAPVAALKDSSPKPKPNRGKHA